MLPPLPRCRGRAYSSLKITHPYQPSPIPLSGRPAHRPFRDLLGVHSRCGLHTRAVTKFVTAIRGLQTFRHLHACPGCFRLERSPGGPCTHWKSAALSRRTWTAGIRVEASTRATRMSLQGQHRGLPRPIGAERSSKLCACTHRLADSRCGGAHAKSISDFGSEILEHRILACLLTLSAIAATPAAVSQTAP